MAINVEEIIDKYGKDKARALILEKCFTLVEFHLELGLSTQRQRTCQKVYQRAFKYLGIESIPYPQDTKQMRLFKCAFDKVDGRYWEQEYIVEELIDRIYNRATTNKQDGSVRLVVSFPRHPKADPKSNQIKAHIVLWELLNNQYVPENYWVVPKDGSYTNLDQDNWDLVSATAQKSSMFTGIDNPQYKHGLRARPKLGGWDKISTDYRAVNKYCSICSCESDLVVHHLINYHLFPDPIQAHQHINLMVLCRVCHIKLHQTNLNIKAHIEATQYSKLFELLETLKSQVSDTLMETYRDVEKQLGLTDNQQPST